VLAGVGQGLPCFGPVIESTNDRCGFHEVRPGSHDVKSVHGFLDYGTQRFDSSPCCSFVELAHRLGFRLIRDLPDQFSAVI